MKKKSVSKRNFKEELNESNKLLIACFAITVVLIAVVGIFDFAVISQLKNEKNAGVTPAVSGEVKNLSEIINSSESKNKVIVENGLLCYDTCSTSVTLDNVTIEYKNNAYFINNTEVSFGKYMKKIIRIDSPEYANYLLINLVSNQDDILGVYDIANNKISYLNK